MFTETGTRRLRDMAESSGLGPGISEPGFAELAVLLLDWTGIERLLINEREESPA